MLYVARAGTFLRMPLPQFRFRTPSLRLHQAFFEEWKHAAKMIEKMEAQVAAFGRTTKSRLPKKEGRSKVEKHQLDFSRKCSKHWRGRFRKAACPQYSQTRTSSSLPRLRKNLPMTRCIAQVNRRQRGRKQTFARESLPDYSFRAPSCLFPLSAFRSCFSASQARYPPWGKTRLSAFGNFMARKLLLLHLAISK